MYHLVAIQCISFRMRSWTSFIPITTVIGVLPLTERFLRHFMHLTSKYEPPFEFPFFDPGMKIPYEPLKQFYNNLLTGIFWDNQSHMFCKNKPLKWPLFFTIPCVFSFCCVTLQSPTTPTPGSAMWLALTDENAEEPSSVWTCPVSCAFFKINLITCQMA